MIPLLSSGVCSLLSSMPGIFMLMFGRASMGEQIGMLISLKECDYEDLCFVLLAL